MVLFVTPTALISVPWDYYFDFVVEERHGFNKKTPAIFFADLIKQWGVILVLVSSITAGILKVIDMFGKNFVPFLTGFM